MAGISTNRSDIGLPTEVSSEILAKTREGSAVMRLARKIALPGNGLTIPMITGDPEASWVDETGKKPVSNPGLGKKIMQAYKLAVIVPFSDEFRRDAKSLYDSLIERLPLSLAEKFDATVFGAVSAPGANFDTFASCTAQAIDTDAYQGLVAADTDIAEHKGILNGFALSPQGKGILLASVDDVKRPLFIHGVQDNGIPVVLGAPVHLSRAAYVEGASASGDDPAVPDTVGVAGDWTQALYGTVEGVKVSISDQATLTISDEQVNLWEHNMFAVRAEIEVGFRADTSVFNKLTRTHSA